MEEQDLLTPSEFAAKIKEKYPQYKDVEDSVLVEKMIAKYPEYESKINFDTAEVPKEAPAEVSGDSQLTSASTESLLESKDETVETPSWDDTSYLPEEDPSWDDQPQAPKTDDQKWEDFNWWEESKKKMKANANTALAGLAGLPNYYNKTLFTLLADDKMLETANSMSPKDRENLINTIMGGVGQVNPAASTLGNSSAELQEEFLANAEAIQEDIIQFDNMITDDLDQGNYKRAAARILTEGIGSIPSIIQALTPYVGIASIAAGSAANKQEELENEGYDLGWDTSTNAAVNGTAEAVFELVTKKLGGKMFNTFKNSTPTGRATILQGLKEHLIKSPLYEGGSEGATSLVQNLSDMYIQGKEKEFNQVWKEFTDAALIGSFVGTGFGGTTFVTERAQSIHEDIKREQILKSDTNDFNSVMEAYNPDLPMEFSMDQLKMTNMPSTINKLSKDLKKEVKAGNMTQEQANAYEHRHAEMSNALKKSQGIKMSDQNRTQAVNLIVRKEKLQAEVKGMDEALAEGKKAEIDNINTQLAALAAGIPLENLAAPETTTQPDQAVERTDDIDVPNTPEGTFINVGMVKGKTNEALTESDITGALPEGVEVINSGVKTVESEGGTEQTLSLQLSRPLTDPEMSVFLKATDQMAIPQLTEGKGAMFGTKDWGDFNPEYFSMPDNRQLTEIQTENKSAELRSLENRNVTYVDKATNEVIDGELITDGKTLTVQTTDGRVVEVQAELPNGELTSNIDQINEAGLTPQDLSIRPQESFIEPNDDGTFTYNRPDNMKIKKGEILSDNKQGTKAIVKDKNGNIRYVQLYRQDGTEAPRLKGQDAQDAAYQIQLREKQKDGTDTKTTKSKPTTSKKEGRKDNKKVSDRSDTGDVKTDKKREALGKQVENVQKAVSKIAPDMKIVVHDTAEDMQAANKNTNTSGTNGLYDPNTNTIHIDASNAEISTVAHEAFHAVLKHKLGSDKKIQEVTDQMYKELVESLDPSMRDGLESIMSYYDSSVQSEEALAELVGFLSGNYAQLNAKSKNIIKQWIDKIANMLGLKPFTGPQVVDLVNTLAERLAKGDVITEEDLSIVGKESTSNVKVDGKTKFQSNFKDDIFGYTFSYDKNSKNFKNLEKEGYINRGVKLSNFSGRTMLLHQPDGAFSGEIRRGDDLIVEGKGGVFYPIKFNNQNYFWASTKFAAEKMAKDLNKISEQNEGRVFMALTSAPVDKLLSSTTMSNGVMDFFLNKAFDRSVKLPKGEMQRALVEAAKATETQGSKKVGLGMKVNLTAKLDETVAKIREKLSPDNSSFGDRKLFVTELIGNVVRAINTDPKAVEQFGKFFSKGVKNKYFKGVTKTGKLRLSKANVTQAISDMLSEPLTKDFQAKNVAGGHIYAVLELNGKVKPVKSEAHESYPMAIVGESGRTKLHILDEAVHWTKVTKDPKTGELIKPERQKRVFPSSGVSVGGVVIESKTKRQMSGAGDKLKSLADKARNESKKRDQEPLRRRIKQSWAAIFDRQARAKIDLNDAGMKNSVTYMVTAAGASSLAKNRVEEARKIFKGFNEKEVEAIEEILFAQRTIAINYNRQDRGLPPLKRMGDFTTEDAWNALDDYKQKWGDRYDDLESAARKYFEEYKKLLTEMKEEGIISQETFDMFAEVDYMPTRYIDFMTEMDESFAVSKLEGSEKSPLSQQQIRAFKEGHTGSQFMDAMDMLERSIAARTFAVFANRLNTTFNKEFTTGKAKYDAILKKDPSKRTKAEKKFVENFKRVDDMVFLDEVVGFTESGNPKYKLDGKTKEGFSPLYYYEDGVRQRMYVRDELHEQITDTQKKLLSGKARENVALLSGTAVVKTLATGNNPFFFLTNTPRDFMFALLISKEYGNEIISNSIKLGYALVKGVGDVVGNTENFKLFLEYGGGMDYLALQGKYKDKGWTKELKDKVVHSKVQKAGSWLGNSKVIKAINKFNQASEMGIRLAVFNKSVKNQLGKRDINTLPKAERDLIYTNAVRSARELSDFSQGGQAIKAFDASVPYLNAGTQGTRALVQSAAERPLDFFLRSAQIATYSVGTTTYLALSLISAFRDDSDDEVKDMTNNEIYLETIKNVSQYDLDNYFIIPTGKRNPDGNWAYLRIAKAQGMSPLLNMTEHYVRTAMAKNSRVKYNEPLGSTLRRTISHNIIPIETSLKKAPAQIPLVNASFALYGIDTYTGNPLSWDRGKIPEELEGLVSNRVEPMYKEMGEAFGMSSLRLQKAVESFITTPSTNPYIGVVYTLGNTSLSSKERIDEATMGYMNNMVENLTKRVYKHTSPYNAVSKLKQRVEEAKVEAYKRAIIVENQVGINVAKFRAKEMTAGELKDKVMDLYKDNPDMGDKLYRWTINKAKKVSLPPLYYAMKYESNKEARAYIMAENYGDAFVDLKSLDDTQKKEIQNLLNHKIIDPTTYKYYKGLFEE